MIYFTTLAIAGTGINTEPFGGFVQSHCNMEDGNGMQYLFHLLRVPGGKAIK